MPPIDTEREWTILNEALDLDESERSSFLDSACAGDAALRRRLETLLAAARRADDFLETPAFLDDPEFGDARPGESLIGQTIGRYRTVELIAEGGMGVVFRAEQDAPTRTVALKVGRWTLPDRTALRRFHYEVEILGRLRHPGIAQIYEAGMHAFPPPGAAAEADDGGQGAVSVPYFAMEFIPDARPITEYAEAARLDRAARLRLFVRVCEAVHHGHLNGVIHRDLKPANILVDPTGQPKVIDFGVARAVDVDLAGATIRTDAGQLVGTLQYMSPEQCAPGTPPDSRSDVYSLGVVLYELLSGSQPYEVRHTVIHEAARVICEERPRALSTADRTLRGDLETIVLKALEKEPSRRYSSVSEFAADIERFLNHEPIAARPPSATYQLRMLARRHKFGVAALTAMALVVIASALGMGWLALRLDERRRVAAEEMERSRSVNDFFAFVLTSVAPVAGRGGKDVTVREALDHAAAHIDSAFHDQPRTEAWLRNVLGQTYLSISEFASAATHLERSLTLRRDLHGDSHPATAYAKENLALLYADLGRFHEAKSLANEAHEVFVRRYGTHHEHSMGTLRLLATLAADMGRAEEAAELMAEVVAFYRQVDGEDVSRILVAMASQANALMLAGRLAEAEEVYHTGLQMCRDQLGADHGQTLRYLYGLADVLNQQGRHKEALPLAIECVHGYDRVLGADLYETLLARHTLAGILMPLGDFESAARYAADAALGMERLLGMQHPVTAATRARLGEVLVELGRWEEAESLLIAGYESALSQYGSRHPETLGRKVRIGNLYLRMGDLERAEATLHSSYEAVKSSLPPEHPVHRSALGRMVELRHRQGRFADALALGDMLVRARQEALGPAHPSVVEVLELLVTISDDAGLEEESERYRKELQRVSVSVSERGMQWNIDQ